LNLFDLHSTKKDRKIKKAKETKPMEKTMKINGMMCPHCSGRVKQVLEALAEVDEAIVSHESGTAVITATADDADALRAKCAEVITEAGYTVVG
jgi:Cu2+-exporting ATPase